MNNENIYFGIKFPVDFILKEEQKRKLAKLLFMSPSTTAKEANEIITNTRLIGAINLLIENLSCELDSIYSEKNEDEILSDEDEHFDAKEDAIIEDVEKMIQNKLVEWAKVFTIPSEDEIIEISKTLNVPSAKTLIKILNKAKFAQLNTPAKIAEYLSSYIVGQTDAVKSISLIVHDHKIRETCDFELPKISCLFIGETGTGKSYIVNKAREILDVPMIRINCGDIVPSGIVGYTITKAIRDLYLLAGSNIRNTEHGILHFDEFDKLSKHNHDNDDNWKTTTQFELLKFFDMNEKIAFPSSHEYYATTEYLSTNNLVLIFSGAFHDIDSIIYTRLIKEFNGNSKLIDKNNLIQYCTPDDLQKYGIIPELAGRLSFFSPLNKLTQADIYKIIAQTKDSEISKHLKKCEIMGVKIRFTEDALQCIAEKVTKQNLGARYINTILIQILKDVYYNFQNHQKEVFVVDAKKVLNACNYNRYTVIYNEFEKRNDLKEIAEKFEIDIDNLLDIYLEFKSMKNGGQNYVI